MKLSPKAIAQLYPHLASTNCEAHGDQPRAKVPQQLLKVFQGRADEGWACSSCVAEAKEQLDKHARGLKAQKKAEKEAQREEHKKNRELAKEADKVLQGYISKAEDARKAVEDSKEAIEQAKSGSSFSRCNVQKAKDELKDAEIRLSNQLLKLQEADAALESSMKVLDSAFYSLDSCYNELREELQKADTLWESLGKSARKHRDKVVRKTAVDLLKDVQDG